MTIPSPEFEINITASSKSGTTTDDLSRLSGVLPIYGGCLLIIVLGDFTWMLAAHFA
jgi:hypothetical protein